MKAHDWVTAYDILKNEFNLTQADFYRWIASLSKEDLFSFCRRYSKGEDQYSHCLVSLGIEPSWIFAKRPYYTLFPSIVPMLERVPLDIRFRDLPRVREPTLLIRFTDGHERDFSGDRLLSILFSCCCGLGSIRIGGTNPGFSSFWLSDEGVTIEDEIANRTNDLRSELVALVTFAIRMCVGVLLIGNDSDLVEPDVLSKDRQRWEETRDYSIVERAQRRGKVGWIIGRKMESIPHYRRPHLAIRWTEKGRSVPRIVPIKGSVVHRKKITDVPMGYLDDEENGSRSTDDGRS